MHGREFADSARRAIFEGRFQRLRFRLSVNHLIVWDKA